MDCSTALISQADLPAPVAAHLSRSTRWRSLVNKNTNLAPDAVTSVFDTATNVQQAADSIRFRSVPPQVADHVLNHHRYGHSKTVLTVLAGNLWQPGTTVLEQLVEAAEDAPQIADNLVRYVIDQPQMLQHVLQHVSPLVRMFAGIRWPGCVPDTDVFDAAADVAADLPDPPVNGGSYATPLKVAAMAVLIRQRGVPDNLLDAPAPLITAAAVARQVPAGLVADLLNQDQSPWWKVTVREIADDPLHPERDAALRRCGARDLLLPDLSDNPTTAELLAVVRHKPVWNGLTGRGWTMVDLANQANLTKAVTRSLVAHLRREKVLRWVGTYAIDRLPSSINVPRTGYSFIYTVNILPNLVDQHLVRRVDAPSVFDTWNQALKTEAHGGGDVKYLHTSFSSRTWLADKLGNDPQRWELCLNLIEGFEGTVQELVDLIDLLDSDDTTSTAVA